MNHRSLVSCLVVAILAGGAAAQNAGAPVKGKQPAGEGEQKARPQVTLKVGDPAPAIKVDKWVKGSEVAAFEKGKPYIVEFWATWCPPCRKSIPHLTEVAQSNKELTVIGVASSERQGKDGDRRLEVLEQFVKDKGDEMNYTVAYDADREMGREWMAAAGQGGIPTAFLVNREGKIAWIGNPLAEEFDDEVAKLVGGSAPTTEAKPHGNDGIKKKK